MKNIAVVIPKYGLVGGAEQFAAELTQKIRISHPYDFSVFANQWSNRHTEATFHKVPIISFPKFLTTLSFAYFVRRRLAAGSFDIIHTHERIFAADLHTLHGVPHRYWIHRVRRKQMSLYDAATAWVERRLVYEGDCKKFVAVSQLTKEVFLQTYPLHPDRVAVIHPGVTLADYGQKDKDLVRRDVRRAWGIGNTDPVIIFASMNFEIKGLDNILRSLGQLKRQNIHFKLIVAGKGNTRKYTKLAEEAQISENVIFTGILDKKSLSDLYLAGDLYMMLSKFDTFGMVVLEAMAAGLPVMISSHVGARDLVDEGKNGFVISDPSDHHFIASKLNILLDENVRKRMSAAAYQTATRNTWDIVAAKYSDIYQDILEAKHKKGS